MGDYLYDLGIAKCFKNWIQNELAIKAILITLTILNFKISEHKNTNKSTKSTNIVDNKYFYYEVVNKLLVRVMFGKCILDCH